MTTKPTIGFSALAKIQPDTDPPPSEAKLAEVDAVAERNGFRSREPVHKVLKRPPTTEPTAGMSLRAPVSVYNRFVKFSQVTRMSYAEALEELLRLANIDEEGRGPNNRA